MRPSSGREWAWPGPSPPIRLPRLEEIVSWRASGVVKPWFRSPHGMSTGAAIAPSGVGHRRCGFVQVVDPHRDPHALVERSARFEHVDHALVGRRPRSRAWRPEPRGSRPCLPVLPGPSARSGRRRRGIDEWRRRSRRRPPRSAALGPGSLALLPLVCRGASLVSLNRRVSAHGSACQRTADRECMPERPLSSTSVGSVNENCPERSVRSRTSRETRISPPRASAAIRAARTTSFP